MEVHITAQSSRCRPPSLIHCSSFPSLFIIPHHCASLPIIVHHPPSMFIIPSTLCIIPHHCSSSPITVPHPHELLFIVHHPPFIAHHPPILPNHHCRCPSSPIIVHHPASLFIIPHHCSSSPIIASSPMSCISLLIILHSLFIFPHHCSSSPITVHHPAIILPSNIYQPAGTPNNLQHPPTTSSTLHQYLKVMIFVRTASMVLMPLDDPPMWCSNGS